MYVDLPAARKYEYYIYMWVEYKDDTGISIVSTMYYYITLKIVHYCIYVTIMHYSYMT